MSLRPDLDAAAATASDRKYPLGMPADERHRLMETLLRLNQLAMGAFDVLEADQISERDTYLFLQLPDYCNAFTEAMTRFARARAATGARLNARG